jgi:hypothetical protein
VLSWVTPVHGICQGNGTGPAIWVVLSTPLLNLLRECGLGCTFTSPISQETVYFVGYSFIDDTDLIQTAKKGESSLDVAAALQHSVETWEGGLRATGGAMVLEKTFWYLVDFEWIARKCQYKAVKDTPYEVFV